MKRSASQAELCSERKDPLENPLDKSDAVEPTQVDLGLEPHRIQEQGNVGEGSVQAGLGLESYSFQEQPNVEEVTIQAHSCGGVQPAQAGLGLELQNFQEQPNVEEVTIQAHNGAAVQSTQAGLGVESCSFPEQPNVEEAAIQANNEVAVPPTEPDLWLEYHSFQEQPNIEEGANLVNWLESHCFEEQPNVKERLLRGAAHPNPSNCEEISADELYDGLSTLVEAHVFVEEPSQTATGHVEAPHQEEAPPDTNNKRNVGYIKLADVEDPIDGEEDAGIQARAGRQQMQDGPPQQGTTGGRMRLQVTNLHSASDYKGIILALQNSYATSSCIGLWTTFPKVPLGDAKQLSEPECASIASSETTCTCCGMSLEQEAPNSSIKDAEITKTQQELSQAVSDEECLKPCMECGSGLTPCLFWVATMLALILLYLFRSFCRLTRTAFTSV